MLAIRSRFGVVPAVTALFVSVAAAVAAVAPARAADPSSTGLFGSREIRSEDLTPFTKWTSTLERAAGEGRGEAASCGPAATDTCPLTAWRAFLAALRGAGRWQQLVAVNAYMNAHRYVADEDNWGVADHWSTPGEFLARSGDCEDFAIAKYLSLRALGWKDADLRIVAVEDVVRGVGHAVVVAVHAGRPWLLDNQFDTVTDAAAIRRYRPVFSINATAWWLHRSEPRA